VKFKKTKNEQLKLSTKQFLQEKLQYKVLIKTNILSSVLSSA